MSFTLTKLPTKKNEEIEVDEAEEFKLTKAPEPANYPTETLRALAQGGLDLSAIGALPFYPFEKGLQKAFGLENVQGPSEQQEERFGQQYDVLEKMRNEGYAPSFEELMSLSDDDLQFGTGTGLEAIAAMQESIPEGSLYQEGLRRVVRSAPFGVGGAFKEAVGSEFAGLGARELIKEMGGSETAQTVGDVTGGLMYALRGLLTKQTGQTVPYVAQKQGGIMQAIEKQSPQALEKRIHSLSTETINDLNKRLSQITDKEIPQLTQFSAREIEEAIASEATNKALDKISPKDVLPQQAWTDVKEAATSLYEAEKAVYTPLYETVRKAAKNITYRPEKSSAMARNTLKKLTNVKTSPTGYNQTANVVRDVLHDLTGVSPNAEIIKTAMETKNEALLNAIYQSLDEATVLTADKLMDLSIRLNDIINYETLIPNVKNFLKPLQKTVKEELKVALKENRLKDAMKDFLSGPKGNLVAKLEEADKLYQRTADRFGKDAITTLRTTENPERMTNVFSQPSNLENLIKLFGKNSPEVRNAERQIIGELGEQSTKKANDTLKQLSPYLSEDAKQVGKEVIALGDNLSVQGQRRALQKNMLEDVAEAVTTGKPPNYTTRAMLTPEGYQTAKQTFNRSKSGREVFKTLEKKLLSDIFDPVIVNGEIDWVKASQILDNPNTSLVVSEIAGTEGLAMARNLQQYGQNIAQNLNLLQKSKPTTFNKVISKLDSPTKILLAAVVGKAVAAPLWLTGAAGGLLLKNVLASAITNKKALLALRGLANSSEITESALKNTNILNSVLQEELAE